MKTILKFNLLVGMMLSFALATTMHAQQTAEEWLQAAEEAIDDGRTTDAGSAYSAAANKQMESGDYEAAAENFKKAAEKFRQDGRTAQAGAETTNAAGAYEAAAEKAAEEGNHTRAGDLYDKAAAQYDADGRTAMAEGARRKAENERAYAEQALNNQTSYETTATGNTSGEVAQALITNAGVQPQTFTIPAGTMDSDGNSQGFVISQPTVVSVPGSSTITAALTGYCTHPRLPAPEPGSQLPPPQVTPVSSTLVAQTNRIIAATTRLLGDQVVFTPFDDPGRAREILTQYTIWTAVPDHPLTLDEVCERFVNDYEAASGKPYASLSPEEKAVVDYGTLQIKDAVTQIGRAADIPVYTFPALPPDASRVTDALPSSNPDVAKTINVISTANPTGHIADMIVSNPTDRPIVVKIGDGSAYIPGNGRQPLSVPEIPLTPLAPGETITIPIIGYCADIRIPPVPAGGGMPNPQYWISIGGPVSVTRTTVPPGHDLVTIPTSQALPLHEALTTIRDTYSPGPDGSMSTPCPEGTLSTLPFIPGTNVQLPQPIDPDEFPGIGVPLVLDAMNKITQSYAELYSQGEIQTPFSPNPEKEREAVIQQAFWIYTSALRGEPYEKEKFRGMTATQFEQTTGKRIEQIPEPEQEKFVGGVDAFWTSFNAVVKPTGVPNITVAPAPVQTVENDMNRINPTQIKDPRERVTGPDGTPVIPGEPIGDPNVPPELIKTDACDCGPISLKATLLGIPMQPGEVHNFNTTGNQRKMISESKVMARTGDKLKIDLTDIKTECGSCNNRRCNMTNLKITAIYGELSVNTPNSVRIAPGKGSSADVTNNSIEVDMPDGDLDVGFFINVSFDCSLANCEKITCDATFVLKVKRQGVCACKEIFLTPTVKHDPADKTKDATEEPFTFLKDEFVWRRTVAIDDVINVEIEKTDPKIRVDNLKADCEGCKNTCVAENFRCKVFGTNITGLTSEADADEVKYSSNRTMKLLTKQKIIGDGDASISIKVLHTCASKGCDSAECEKTYTILFKGS